MECSLHLAAGRHCPRDDCLELLMISLLSKLKNAVTCPAWWHMAGTLAYGKLKPVGGTLQASHRNSGGATDTTVSKVHARQV